MEIEAKQRMFYAMVLMGSSAALACGGVASRSHDDAGDGGSGGSSANAGTPAAGGPSPGGGMGPGSGGSFAQGGGGSMPAQGGAAPEPPEPNCAPAQWDCSGATLECSAYNNGFVLPRGCVCDSSRPLSADECPSTLRHVCRWAGASLNGQLDEPVGFDCRCAPAAGDACSETCRGRFQNYDIRCLDDGVGDVLCGCAVVLLK